MGDWYQHMFYSIESIRGGVLLFGSSVLFLLVLTACGVGNPDFETSEYASSRNDSGMSGTVEIDGSSTVYPISEAVAEEFNKLYPNVRVNVGVSGTGGGFKRFTVGETDISDASRP
ncbi:MAG: substrate-binding domain-containing protein, partial [Dehalococcoidia bacterium]|nr:substrate-binding domain-containing protein [Dehalococcoidia bacterium]